MNALVISDVEGVYGVYSMNDTKKYIDNANKEIELILSALNELCIFDITVCDAHNNGDTLKSDKIRKYSNNDNPLISQLWNMDMNKKYDFAIMTGMHGMNGSNGILSHTIRFDIKNMLVGGYDIGEIELFRRWLGHYNIPVILVMGDFQAIKEANFFNPYTQTCCVKSKVSVNNNDKALLYEKIKSNIKIALMSDFKNCISYDNDALLIEFLNKDLLKYFPNKNDGRFIYFDNCFSFIHNLIENIEIMNKANQEIFDSNLEFVQELKGLLKNTKKEDIKDEYIKSLLNKNLFELDNLSKKTIIEYININF